MPDDVKSTDRGLPDDLRYKLLQDLANGRTVTLPASELARVEIREQLDVLFEQLHQDAGTGATRIQIAGYTVLGEIGHGGMSTVYLARHTALDRCVALKVVPNWLGGQEKARERVLREARAMARLSHPNIVAVHDIVDRGETIAIAMEWVDGLTLADLLRTLPTQPATDDAEHLRQNLGAPATGHRLEASVTRTFVRMMVDIARAVHCVHQNGLLHLDIKPSNVLVRRDGTALLADFGVVREVDLLLTHTGSFAGTPIYAAPEQLARETRSLGPATDVYGLGMTLYELLARHQPLRQEGLTKVLQDIQAGRIPPLASLAEVSDDLANIVHKAISLQPERRYASAAALADDLQAFLDGRAVSARPQSATERIARWVRAEPWKALLAAALAVLLPVAGGLGLVLVREQDNIAQGKRLALQRQLAEDTNGVFQQFVAQGSVRPDHLGDLLAQQRLEPTDAGALATLLVVLSLDQPDTARRVLQEARDAGVVAVGLDLTEQRLAAGRQFFTPSELEKLRGSKIPIDAHLRILDRFYWAVCANTRADFGPVDDDLENAILIGKAPSPLLLGLRTWTATMRGDAPRFERTVTALRANWPDQAVVNLWPAIVHGFTNQDPAKALDFAENALARDPGNPSAKYLVFRSLRQLKRYEEAFELAQPLESTHAPHWWPNQRALLLALMGRQEEARQSLRAPAPTEWPDLSFRLALGKLDPDELVRRYEEVITSPRRPPIDLLVDAMLAADVRKDLPTAFAAAQRGFALYPEFPAFRWMLFREACANRRFARAAELSAGMLPPEEQLDGIGSSLARVAAHTKHWSRLLEFSEHWLKHGKEEMHRPHYWKGIALLRLGRRAEGLKCLDEHLRIALELDGSQPNGKGRTYAEVQYEKAWAVLDPRLPPAERHPQVPPEASDWRRSVVLRSADRNAWFGCVVAHLHAAEGNREKALEQALAAKAMLAQKSSEEAPADLPQRLDALIESLQPR